MRAVANLRNFRLPRRLRITAEGKAFLLFTVGAGIAAINTGNNLLYVAFCMNLSLIILSGILSEWCLRRISVRVRGAAEAFARAESLLSVTCFAGGKRFPAISLAVTLRAGEEKVTARFPFIPAGGNRSRVVPFHPLRRGPFALSDCRVSTKFPFALFEKSADVVPDVSLLVYPAPAASDPLAGDGAEPGLDGRASAAGRHGDSIRGAREHMPADPMRDIHWKASARLGKWMVKEREGESRPAVDLRLPPAAEPEEFEGIVSRACAGVLLCEAEGRPYRLWQGDRLYADRDHGRTGALSFLALARHDGSPGPAEKTP